MLCPFFMGQQYFLFQTFPWLSSYCLNNLCEEFNISLFEHHNCECDALAAASLMLFLIENNCKIFHAIDKPVTFHPSSDFGAKKRTYYDSKAQNPVFEEAHINYDDIEELVFKGKSFVITGEFERYSRTEISEIIISRGGTVFSSISKKIDYLVVAFQNLNFIKDTEQVKSNKLIKAESLRASGSCIKIISDEYFISCIECEKN